MRLLRHHRSGPGAEPPDQAQHRRPRLLAHVLAKFADHLPLYRQVVIYAREGVDLDRALLASYVGAASALLRPLVDAISRRADSIEAACRRYADSGACARQWQNQDGALVELCAR